MKIFFSVGEPSGDLHAANLIRQLRLLSPDTEFVGFGGPQMQRSGCKLLFELTTLAVMFLSGAISNLRTFLRLITTADRYFAENQVDAVVLIDYPGFNWWIARKAKKRGVPVFYYGVPQMWAWAPWRIKKVRRFVDHVICKLPFEPEWFQQRGCLAHYVGHPYFDEMQNQRLDQPFIDAQNSEQRPMLLLLPGSRDSEVERNIETLLAVASRVRRTSPEVRVAVGCFSERHQSLVQRRAFELFTKVETFVDRTQELMSIATCCVACSGSVSLELLHHRLPTVIVYRVSPVKYLLQKALIRCRYISLPNLIAADSIARDSWSNYDPDAPDAEPLPMPEYLTWRSCAEPVAKRVLRWIESASDRHAQIERLDGLAQQFAIPGASEKAATIILDQLAGGTETRARIAA